MLTRQQVFFAAVQTIAILDGRGRRLRIAQLFDAASQLDVEAYADQPAARAAQEFFHWFIDLDSSPKDQPKWLAAYCEEVSDRVLVRVSEETSASTWWMHAERAYEDSLAQVGPPIPPIAANLVVGRERGIVMRRAEAALFRAWVEHVPGSEEEPFTFDQDGEAPR